MTPTSTQAVAPSNNLPTWAECNRRVEVTDHLAERSQGGPSPECEASELHRFIYEYDDADSHRSEWFLHRLEKVLEENRETALADLVARLESLAAEWDRMGSRPNPVADDYYAGQQYGFRVACQQLRREILQAPHVGGTATPELIPGTLAALNALSINKDNLK